MVGSKKVEAELDKALALLKKFFGFEFPRPKLYLGDKYISQFMEVSSFSDLIYSMMVQMIYNDEKN